MKQFSLFPKSSLHHGGELAAGKRKRTRPLDRKRPLHIVVKTRRSLRKEEAYITNGAKRFAEEFSCRLYDVAVNEDHVHLVIKIPGRSKYNAFIRSLTALMARKLGKNLFRLLPFTRIVNWGKDYLSLKRYFRKNREEAAGTRPYESRKDWYQRYRRKP